MSYAELYEQWASKYAFGAKGELTINEAKNIHRKWAKLGTLAKKGLL
jgi:hypothetical protein